MLKRSSIERGVVIYGKVLFYSIVVSIPVCPSGFLAALFIDPVGFSLVLLYRISTASLVRVPMAALTWS